MTRPVCAVPGCRRRDVEEVHPSWNPVDLCLGHRILFNQRLDETKAEAMTYPDFVAWCEERARIEARTELEPEARCSWCGERPPAADGCGTCEACHLDGRCRPPTNGVHDRGPHE